MTVDRPLRTAALGGVFIAVLLLALLVLFPLSLAVSGRAASAGLSAAETRGTVWRGEMTQAQFGGVRLGDLKVGANPLALLIGQTRLGMKGDTIAAKLQFGRGVFAARNLTARLPLAGLAPGVGLDGTLLLQEVDARTIDGGCSEAEGEAALAAVSVQGLELPGLELRGALACGPAGGLVLPLRGQADGVDVQADLRLAAGGAYELDLLIRSTRPEVDAALSAAGFERRLEGRGRRSSGMLAGL